MSTDSYRPRPLHFERRPEAEMEARGRDLLGRMAARRSVRHFSPEAVPRRLVELAIATANTAPSGAHFVAVSDPETKRRIREAAEAAEREFYQGDSATPEWLEALAHLGTGWEKPYLETAPWLVAVFKEIHGVDDHGAKVTNYYVAESVGIACGLFVTALHLMGLATLTHTPQPMRFLSSILGRPSNERPFILFPVGYPAEECRVPTLDKKTLADVTTWVEPPA